jgi:hypothetical protein
MLKAIPGPEKTTIEADIKVQLQKALVSTIPAIDPSLDDSFCTTKLIKESQADYIPLDAGDIKRNYLDANDDADTRLF